MADITIFNLKCEYETSPMGVQNAHPLLGWQIRCDRPVMQEAYEIAAASSRENLEQGIFDLMDSGKVVSPRSYGIAYDGKKLRSGQQVWWKVKIWTQDGTVSDFCEPACFETGLLDRKDWKGVWLGFLGGMVGNGILMRHHFQTEEKEISRARAYVCCAGYYEFHLNGKVYRDKLLDPAPTDISRTVLYSVYDVTEDLRRGKNVVGFVLGTGFAGLPKILLQMNIDYSDGSRQEVFSTYGESWCVSRGPIVYNALYDGEDYDARRERTGWDTPEYEETFLREFQRPNGWIMCTVVEDPGGERVGEIMPPIRVRDTYEPVLLHTFADGTAIYDAGYTITGWVEIGVSGRSGDQVHLSFAEVLDEEGRLEKTPLRTARCEDHYILRGEEQGETYEPRFTYHGFRYFSVQTEGDVKIHSLKAKFVCSSLKDSTCFTSDQELFNRIADAMRRTDACNFMGIPTDCAQRDERHGWQTDPTSNAEGSAYTFDMSGFFMKWLRDMYDTQNEEGYFSDTAPYRWGWRPNDPQANIPVGMLLLLYRMYGNRREMETHYQDIWRYVHALLNESKDWMISRSPYGEWACPKDQCFYEEYGPGANPKYVSFPFVSTTFFYFTLLQLQKMSELLGKEDLDYLKNLSEVVRKKINDTYFNPETGQYDQGSQSANAMAVTYGLADREQIPAVLQNIVADLEKHDHHITTGSVGTRAVIEALCENGFEEEAFRVMSQTSAPSYGYMIRQGATTIWERWEADDNNNIMNSRNQPMLAQACLWFYKYLGGFRPDCTAEGEQILTLFPLIPDAMKYADTCMDLLSGPVRSSWEKEGDVLTIRFEIPQNLKTEAKIPGRYGKITDARCVSEDRSITPVRVEDGLSVYSLHAGKYSFILQQG